MWARSRLVVYIDFPHKPSVLPVAWWRLVDEILWPLLLALASFFALMSSSAYVYALLE